MKITEIFSSLPLKPFLLLIISTVFFCVLHAGSSLVCNNWGSSPTLGDDALVYDWRAHFVKRGYKVDQVILKELKVLTEQKAEESPKAEWFRYRGYVRVFGSYTPFSDLLFSFVTRFNLTLKQEFFGIELMVLLLMVVSLALGLRMLTNPVAAGIALLFLAGAWLPNQGLHYHIPSTLTLSLSFLIYSYTLSRDKLNLWFLVPSILILPGFHTIGRAYLLLLVFALCLRPNFTKERERVRVGMVLAFIGLSIMLWSLGHHIFPNVFPFSKGAFGALDIDGALKSNLPASFQFIKEFAKQNVFFCLTLSYILIANREIRTRASFKSFLGPFVLLLLSLLHYPRGDYPAELFSRFLVLMIIILSALTAEGILINLKSRKGLSSWILTGFLLAHLWGGIIRWKDYTYKNLNGRIEFVDIERLREELNRIPKSASVVFSEGDISLMASLLAGLKEQPGFSYQMIMNTSQEKQVFEGSELWGVSPVFRSLNASSAIQSQQIHRRRLGFYFKDFKFVSLEMKDATDSEKIFVLVESQETTPIKMEIIEGVQKQIIEIKPKTLAWIPLKVKTKNPIFSMRPDKAWILGVRSEMSDQIYWPWQEGWRITAVSYPSPEERKVTLFFSLKELFKSYGVEPLGAYLSTRGKVRSDKSGFVIWSF